MKERITGCLYILILSILPAAFAAQDEASPRQLQSTAQVLWQPSMNVFRRFAGFALKTIWFDDPDGITNYFAETAVSGKQPLKLK